MKNKFYLVAIYLAAFLPVVVVACSSNETNTAPSRPPTPSPTTTVPGTDGGPTGDGGTTSSDCFDRSDGGKPATAQEFLNQCNSGECFKFDNAARIEGFVVGQPLPSLAQ